MDEKAFVETIRQTMAERGDTQVIVASKTGIPQAAISRLLNGRTVGMRHTLALVDYLAGVSPEGQEGKTTDVRE